MELTSQSAPRLKKQGRAKLAKDTINNVIRTYCPMCPSSGPQVGKPLYAVESDNELMIMQVAKKKGITHLVLGALALWDLSRGGGQGL
jgi:hypothetical protein